MKEVRVLINGLETNYKIAGSGPAILVLHGWGGSSDSWVKVQEILSEKGYQVIAPDFPGLGVSANPPIAWGV
ncbi:MAG TPA: alpha/beta fold hydrolase, partial [Candidatus Paceibacterota bacterium]|nr:alpha/beta fold hydrolase [Candidatus Paceibacterota bacterium]